MHACTYVDCYNLYITKLYKIIKFTAKRCDIRMVNKNTLDVKKCRSQASATKRTDIGMWPRFMHPG